MNTNLTPQDLRDHYGHRISIVRYGETNYALECEDCLQILADADIPKDENV